MTLASDITRCHDDSCQSRERCLRWLERDTGHSHAASLREPGGYCLSFRHAGYPQAAIEVPTGIDPEHAHAYQVGYLKGITKGWLDCMEQYDIEPEPDEA